MAASSGPDPFSLQIHLQILVEIAFANEDNLQSSFPDWTPAGNRAQILSSLAAEVERVGVARLQKLFSGTSPVQQQVGLQLCVVVDQLVGSLPFFRIGHRSWTCLRADVLPCLAARVSPRRVDGNTFVEAAAQLLDISRAELRLRLNLARSKYDLLSAPDSPDHLKLLALAFERRVIRISHQKICWWDARANYGSQELTVAHLESIFPFIPRDLIFLYDELECHYDILDQRQGLQSQPPAALEQQLQALGMCLLSSSPRNSFFDVVCQWAAHYGHFRLTPVKLRRAIARQLKRMFPNGPLLFDQILKRAKELQPELNNLQTWAEYLAAVVGPTVKNPSQMFLKPSNLEVIALSLWYFSKKGTPLLIRIYSERETIYAGSPRGHVLSVGSLGGAYHYVDRPAQYQEEEHPLRQYSWERVRKFLTERPSALRSIAPLIQRVPLDAQQQYAERGFAFQFRVLKDLTDNNLVDLYQLEEIHKRLVGDRRPSKLFPSAAPLVVRHLILQWHGDCFTWIVRLKEVVVPVLPSRLDRRFDDKLLRLRVKEVPISFERRMCRARLSSLERGLEIYDDPNADSNREGLEEVWSRNHIFANFYDTFSFHEEDIDEMKHADSEEEESDAETDDENMTEAAVAGQRWNYLSALLEIGIPLAGRMYRFLAASRSNIRDKRCTLYGCDRSSSVEDALRWALHVDDIHKLSRSPLKMAIRISHLLSTSWPTVRPVIEYIDDEPAPEGKNSYYTDGCGYISTMAMQQVMESLHQCRSPLVIDLPRDSHPVALQMRIAGAKGMLVEKKGLMGSRILLRNSSMIKFKLPQQSPADSPHLILDVVALAANPPYPARVSGPIIQLINACCTSHPNLHAFWNKMVLRDLQQNWLNPAGFLRKSLDGSNQAGLALAAAGFPMSAALLAQKWGKLFQTFRIELESSCELYGVCDPSNEKLLQDGQVFIFPSAHNSVITGTVLLTKEPCMYAGDLRKFEAVDIPELRYLRDVVVFARRGEVPNPKLMAGSDLDGDTFLCIWHSDLVPYAVCHDPGSFPEPTPSPACVHDDPAALMASEFCLQHRMSPFDLKELEAMHAALVEEVGSRWIDDKDLREFADVITRVVDFPKHGTAPDWDQFKNVAKKLGLSQLRYPEYVQNMTGSSLRPASSLLGLLYRETLIPSLLEQLQRETPFASEIVAPQNKSLLQELEVSDGMSAVDVLENLQQVLHKHLKATPNKEILLVDLVATKIVDILSLLRQRPNDSNSIKLLQAIYEKFWYLLLYYRLQQQLEQPWQVFDPNFLTTSRAAREELLAVSDTIKVICPCAGSSPCLLKSKDERKELLATIRKELHALLLHWLKLPGWDTWSIPGFHSRSRRNGNWELLQSDTFWNMDDEDKFLSRVLGEQTITAEVPSAAPTYIAPDSPEKCAALLMEVWEAVPNAIRQHLHLVPESIPRDGNCLFHALALYTNVDSALLRDQVATYIDTNPGAKELRRNLLLTDPQLISRLRNDAEWGGEEVLIAVARAMMKRIIVVAPGQGTHFYDATGERHAGLPVEIYPSDLFVLYNGRSHYEALISK